MPIKYIGRTTSFSGKTLWEIIGNLKNFGVGRLVKRHMFERYPEPCYNRIIKVETLPNEEVRKVRVWIEKVFRGRRYPRLIELCSASYKADYRLVPKSEEQELIARANATPPQVRVISNTVPFPPLLKDMILKEMKQAGKETVEEPRLKLIIKNGRDNIARLAGDGEEPTIVVEQGLGKPADPELYKLQ